MLREGSTGQSQTYYKNGRMIVENWRHTGNQFDDPEVFAISMVDAMINGDRVVSRFIAGLDEAKLIAIIGRLEEERDRIEELIRDKNGRDKSERRKLVTQRGRIYCSLRSIELRAPRN